MNLFCMAILPEKSGTVNTTKRVFKGLSGKILL
jgi:hypothetical protein